MSLEEGQLDQVSNGSRWQIFGSKLPRDEIVFFSQVFLIYIIAITAIVNLSIDNVNSSLWISLLSASLGYILPSPRLSSQDEQRLVSSSPKQQFVERVS